MHSTSRRHHDVSSEDVEGWANEELDFDADKETDDIFEQQTLCRLKNSKEQVALLEKKVELLQANFENLSSRNLAHYQKYLDAEELHKFSRKQLRSRYRSLLNNTVDKAAEVQSSFKDLVNKHNEKVDKLIELELALKQYKEFRGLSELPNDDLASMELHLWKKIDEVKIEKARRIVNKEAGIARPLEENTTLNEDGISSKYQKEKIDIPSEDELSCKLETEDTEEGFKDPTELEQMKSDEKTSFEEIFYKGTKDIDQELEQLSHRPLPKYTFEKKTKPIKKESRSISKDKLKKIGHMSDRSFDLEIGKYGSLYSVLSGRRGSSKGGSKSALEKKDTRGREEKSRMSSAMKSKDTSPGSARQFFLNDEEGPKYIRSAVIPEEARNDLQKEFVRNIQSQVIPEEVHNDSKREVTTEAEQKDVEEVKPLIQVKSGILGVKTGKDDHGGTKKSDIKKNSTLHKMLESARGQLEKSISKFTRTLSSERFEFSRDQGNASQRSYMIHHGEDKKEDQEHSKLQEKSISRREYVKNSNRKTPNSAHKSLERTKTQRRDEIKEGKKQLSSRFNQTSPLLKEQLKNLNLRNYPQTARTPEKQNTDVIKTERRSLVSSIYGSLDELKQGNLDADLKEATFRNSAEKGRTPFRNSIDGTIEKEETEQEQHKNPDFATRGEVLTTEENRMLYESPSVWGKINMGSRDNLDTKESFIQNALPDRNALNEVTAFEERGADFMKLIPQSLNSTIVAVEADTVSASDMGDDGSRKRRSRADRVKHKAV